MVLEKMFKKLDKIKNDGCKPPNEPIKYAELIEIINSERTETKNSGLRNSFFMLLFALYIINTYIITKMNREMNSLLFDLQPSTTDSFEVTDSDKMNTIKRYREELPLFTNVRKNLLYSLKFFMIAECATDYYYNFKYQFKENCIYIKTFNIISWCLFGIFIYFFGNYIIQQKEKISFYEKAYNNYKNDFLDNNDNLTRFQMQISLAMARFQAKITDDVEKQVTEQVTKFDFPEYNKITFEYMKTLFSKITTSIYVLLIYLFLYIVTSIIVSGRKNNKDLKFYTSFLFNPQITRVLLIFVFLGFIQDYYNNLKLHYTIDILTKEEDSSEYIKVTPLI
jgi:hypothetical protein